MVKEDDDEVSSGVVSGMFELRRRKNDYVAELRHKGLHNLSGEIDRCLKKVSEGVETFEDIWQKVHNATNTNQKEKYEADLKKEIKKLQRLRDQIKSWIASGEIKDKSTLVDTRKLIETQMERFKVVERETKTKAYSKEGLGAAQKLDPTTKEREDLNNWLVTQIDALQIQMDQFESEIELILAAKKKKLDKDKQDRLDELKTSLERHRFHSGKLETLMRMLDNLSMDVNALRQFLSQVKKIKDDVDYYLESNQEPDYEENEFLYDDIEGLEEFDDNLVSGPPGGGGTGGEEGGGDGTPTSTTSGNNSPISPVHSSDASDPEKRRKSSDDSSKVVRPVAMKANHSPSPGVKGVVGTPPKGVGTPNNSSPSSGLSNHVSSLSSLSSSPTHNYHNALNNVKSLALVDAIEHNNSTASGVSTTGLLSKSPSTNSTSIIGSMEGMMSSTTVNGVLENGSSSEDHSSPHTQLISSNTPSSVVVGSLSTTATTTIGGMENGLNSPSPQEMTSASSNNQHFNSSSGTTIDRSQQQQHHHQQLFSDSSSESALNSSSQQQNSASFMQQTLDGFAAAVATGGATAGLSNNLSDSGFASNVSNVFGVSSSSLISNNSSGSGNSNSSSVVLGGSSSSNVIGLTTSIVGSNQNNSVAPGVGSISNTVSSLVSTTTSSLSTSIAGPVGVPAASYSTNSTSNNTNSLISASGSVSSHNSNSGILSQQQIQQLQHYQHQGSAGQSGNSRDTTPISDFLRLNHPQDQMLINRILTDGNESMASLKSLAQDALDRSGLNLGDHNSLENKMREAHIPPLLGVAPLGPVPLQKEHQYQFQMLDAAHCHLPVSADSERMRQFLPRNPYPTPHYYPQTPLTNSDSLEFFQRLSIETLFFIFYYLEGTKAQYMAAKVLKKQSWRFHTKYMMWFQRHEEPKVINEEYEQGTYIYFDIEKWSQRKKDGFVFEYRFLEDRDLG